MWVGWSFSSADVQGDLTLFSPGNESVGVWFHPIKERLSKIFACLWVKPPPPLSYYGEMIKNIRQSVGRHPLHHGEMINDLRPFVGKHQPRHGEIIKDFRLSVGRSPPRRDD